MQRRYLYAFLILTSVVLCSFIFNQYNYKIVPKAGDKAIDLAYPNPQGEVMELSSLKKKIVLIDFWASWCGPCRRTNPSLVKLYDKYKDAKFKDAKGFEIYSVSLDRNKKAWEAAILKDGLVWDYHVSDLKGWSAEGAAKYGVRSIPQTFLVDQDGFIIGRNLRHHDLDFELNKRLKKPLGSH